MTQKRTNCDSCNASILEKTKTRCEGLCAPCYMIINNGFKPGQIESFKRRGLSELVEKWIVLVRKGQPNIRNPLIADRGKEVIPIVYSAVEGYFRSENKKYDGEYILRLLRELKSLQDDELQQYVTKVEVFIMELNRATKS